MFWKDKNKDRLYIAYYARGQTQPDDVPVHTALLLVPSPMRESSLHASRFHVVNRIENGLAGWKYEARKVRPRTVQLVALLLLGKVPSKFDSEQIEEILGQVPVIQDDPKWRCRHWIWSAIKELEKAEVIEPLKVEVEEIWQIGVRLAAESRIDYETPVPACDRSGKKVHSEIESLG